MRMFLIMIIRRALLFNYSTRVSAISENQHRRESKNGLPGKTRNFHSAQWGKNYR